MKKLVRAAIGSTQDFINALEQRIDVLEDGVVTSTQVNASTEDFDNRIVDSMIERLGDDIVHVDTDKLIDVLFDLNPDMSTVYEVNNRTWSSLVDSCTESDDDFADSGSEYHSKYEIHDTRGIPQAGEDVYQFDEWYEVEDFLDQNPDVQERIDEGYATITEV